MREDTAERLKDLLERPAWSVLGANEITCWCGACNYEEKLIQQAEKP
jgi:hypothetical protein